MRISEAGTSSRRRAQRGLTLVELLVVVTIMGLMAGVVVLTMRPPSPLAEYHNQLERELVSLRNESVAQAAVFGVLVEINRYTVLRATAEGWDVVSSVDLPPEVSLSLQLQNEFELPEHEDSFVFPLPDDDDESRIEPQIRFGSLGDVTPFNMRLAAEGGTRLITMGPFGELGGEDAPF